MKLNPIFDRLFDVLVANGYIGNKPCKALVAENYNSHYFKTRNGNYIAFREGSKQFSVAFYFKTKNYDFDFPFGVMPCVDLAFKKDTYINITETNIFIDGVSIWSI